MAVLDSAFRVRGVSNLRVVDASIFPKIPGFFIVTSIYVAAEKAAQVILQDAAAVRAQAVRGAGQATASADRATTVEAMVAPRR